MYTRLKLLKPTNSLQPVAASFLPQKRVGPPGKNITYVVITMPNAQILIEIALNKLVPDVQICIHFLWREMMGVA